MSTPVVALGRGKNVLVTGGAGFVGSHVVDRAMADGANVYVVDNLFTGTSDNFAHHSGHPRFHFVRHDVTHPFPVAVEQVQFDYVFHLASAASPVHYQNFPIETTLTCVNGTNNALRTALRCKCPILIASTSECYGDPLVHPQPETYLGNVSCTGIRSCYDEGKRCAESLCFDYNRHHGVEIKVVRIFNTYGPRMCFNDGRIISNFLVQALSGDKITIFGTGLQTRSFQYVADLVEGFWRFITSKTSGPGPINIGNPEERTVADMANIIKEMTSSSSEIILLPATQDDPKQRRPDITKATEVLGWAPKVGLTEGLTATRDEFALRLGRQQSTIRKLYVQCNPLLDISANVDDAFVAKYNVAKPPSAALVAPEQAGIYAALEARANVRYIPGGSGLNTARVAQWMSRAPKGSFVSYTGCIADDAYGSTLKTSAENDGVNMTVEFTTKAPTGSCAVCVVGNERSLVANLAAANELSAEHMKSDRVAAALNASALFYVSGFTLTLKLDYVLQVAKHALRNNGTFLINLSAPFIIQFFGEQLKAILPYADYVFANSEEAGVFAQTQGWGEGLSTLEIAKKTQALPKLGSRPRVVVFTDGSHPTVYATGSSEGSVPVAPIDAASIVDTNGAGDSFVGGFLAGHALDRPLEQCIRAGNYAAGVIIQHDGCSFPAVPTFTL